VRLAAFSRRPPHVAPGASPAPAGPEKFACRWKQHQLPRPAAAAHQRLGAAPDLQGPPACSGRSERSIAGNVSLELGTKRVDAVVLFRQGPRAPAPGLAEHQPGPGPSLAGFSPSTSAPPAGPNWLGWAGTPGRPESKLLGLAVALLVQFGEIRETGAKAPGSAAALGGRGTMQPRPPAPQRMGLRRAYSNHFAGRGPGSGCRPIRNGEFQGLWAGQ